MKISVVLTNRSNKSVDVQVQEKDSILSIKQTLAKTYEPEECQCFFYLGVMLDNKSTVEASGLEEGATVQMVIIMTAGLASKLEKDEVLAVGLASEAGRGNFQGVQKLLNEGANPDYHQKRHGSTALMTATWNGHVNVVEVLLKSGANLNSADKYGKTPLMYACQYGQDKVITVLVSRGASVEARSKDGRTALMYAARNGGFYPTCLMLKLGAKIAPVDRDGKSAITIAATQDIKNILQETITKRQKENKNQDDY